ncbi:MAG TPA: type II toxin-antitoxin system VapC family toxin, partial [Thermoanaerobaculia bacterium]|nr:type II toxin-antitoxin system VapC family toxin [Thermoanaerobaculia bacterium]
MSYLVDTNVISELRKGERCNESVAAWWSRVAEDEIFLSVLTIGEIRKGIENIRRRDARSAGALEAWLLRVISNHGDRILAIELDVVEEWGRQNVPDPLPVIDSLIAATAKVRGMTLVTRNVDHIARTGVAVV